MLDIFRRHQKKLLAGLALFAMVAFTLDFSILRDSMGPGSENPVVATLSNVRSPGWWPFSSGKKLRYNELNALKAERFRANRYLSALFGRGEFQPFGGLDTRSMVDAWILEREADRLGMPAEPQLALDWLKEITGGTLKAADFDTVYRQLFANEVTDTQLLKDIANQIRIRQVAGLPGGASLTPLDIYHAYRDQEERVSANFVAFEGRQFMDQAPEPTADQIGSFYDEHKFEPPDSETGPPGFLVPRQVAVEYVMADQTTLERLIEQQLDDAALRQIYAARANEFLAIPPELPIDLFANEPELTPDLRDLFAELRTEIARTVSQERARGIVRQAFRAVRDQAIDPFIDSYFDALDARADTDTAVAVPEPGDLLQEAVSKLKADPVAYMGLKADDPLTPLLKTITLPISYQRTPKLSRFRAAEQPDIGSAMRAGTSTFTDVFFDPKSGLYEVREMSDPTGSLSQSRGREFLVWKILDLAEHVPGTTPELAVDGKEPTPLSEQPLPALETILAEKLDEGTVANLSAWAPWYQSGARTVRDIVRDAWRYQQAREIAKTTAEKFASKVEQAGGNLQQVAGAENREVQITTPAPRMMAGMLDPSSFRSLPPTPSDVPQIDHAGTELREALFGLQPGEVAVAPDDHAGSYYVMTMNQREVPMLGDPMAAPSYARDPAQRQSQLFDNIYRPFGVRSTFEPGVQSEASMRAQEEWMKLLRTQAGLPADWTPPDEGDSDTATG